MKHIVTFSGGKDSQATSIWAKNTLTESFEIVFCDTAWEHKTTYQFILEFESKIGQGVKHLKNSKYKGFTDLVRKKKSSPSIKRRFCTMSLKIEPMIDYILDEIQSDCIIYQGIRWEESKNRADMQSVDDYFKHYTTPRITKDKRTGKEKKSYDNYRKKDVLEYLTKYECIVKRPIISWTGSQTMQYIVDEGFTYNPLYDLGFSRVGCFPCVSCNLGEIALMIENGETKRFDIIRKLEQETNSTFFGQGMIPDRYCSKEVEYIHKKTKERKKRKVPLVDDVIRYVKDRRLKQQKMFVSSCKNIYVPCE